MQDLISNPLAIFFKEIFVRRNAMVASFIAINLCALGVGLVWPGVYVSSATVLFGDSARIQRQVKSAAVPITPTNRISVARGLIYSRKALKQVLEDLGWKVDPGHDLMERFSELGRRISGLLGIERGALWQSNKSDVVGPHRITPAEQEELIDAVQKRTQVSLAGDQLIKIEYRDGNPGRAAQVAQKFAELLVNETSALLAEESNAAFQFIDKQVRLYREKLTNAETRLTEWQSLNLDTKPGTEAAINQKLATLQTELDLTNREMAENQIMLSSLQKQLSNESGFLEATTLSDGYRRRILKLQKELDTLRLSYHDAYPSIVKITSQIRRLTELLKQEEKGGQAGKEVTTPTERSSSEGNIVVNPLYAELRQEISMANTTTVKLRVRKAEIEQSLAEEVRRRRDVNRNEAIQAELTREYDVTRQLYYDLLEQRERSRISVNLDEEPQEELRLRIYEPAFLPIERTGPHFMHFALAGLILGVFIPPMILYGILQVDPRIRSERMIEESLGLPVLTVIPRMFTPGETVRLKRNIIALVFASALSVCTTIAIGMLRAYGLL